MTECPKIEPNDWIRVDGVDCVVAFLHEHESSRLGEVVHTASDPTSREFEWDGEQFVFSKSRDFGGYAKGSLYGRAVEILKRGRP